MKSKAEWIGQAAAAIILCVGAVSLIIWGKEAAKGAAAGVVICLNVLIPSLYAFTVISKLLVSSDTYRIMGVPFALPARYIFRLPANCFAVMLISQLTGFPIGAALISEMVRQDELSPDDAQKLLCFCIAPGPAFICAACGEGAPCVFASVVTANFIMAAASSFFRKIPPGQSIRPEVRISASGFSEAVRSGAGAMALICGNVIFFAAALAIAEKVGVLQIIAEGLSAVTDMNSTDIFPFVRAFFEVSRLSEIAPKAAALPLMAALLSFGGICVHVQISAVCQGFSPVKALVCRLPAALLSYIICRKLSMENYAANAVAASAPMGSDIELSKNSPFLSIILLIMTILILSQKSMVKIKKI